MAPQAAWNTSDVSEKARRDLLLLLEGVRGQDGGKKNLVLEKALAGLLNLLVKFSTLQEYGVDKVFFLENENLDASQRNVVFLARGEKATTSFAVAEQIKQLRQKSQIEHEFSIFWVPRRTKVSDMILEEAGVLGEVSISEYQLYFVPLSDDLLSLEMDDSFSDLYLRKDPTCIYLSAQALMQLQQRHGLFPRIIGKGENGKRLADLLLRMRSELTAGEDSSSGATLVGGLAPSTVIESLIVIDREVDFPTVLLTQLTYEGLIDEVFPIQANQTELATSIVGGTSTQQSQQSTANSPANPTSPLPPSQAMKRKIMLDPSESLYSTLRDANFATVGPLLNKVARRLQETYESRHSASRSTAELREFVAKLPGYQAEQASLKLHTALAEELIRYTRTDFFTKMLEIQQTVVAGADVSISGGAHDLLEELISRDVPLPTVLRLLCLESCISGGLRAKELDTFRRAVLLAYGPQHLLTLSALAKMGLLTLRAGGVGIGMGGSTSSTNSRDNTNYPAARRQLHLIMDEVKESDPDDVAYVFSGYAPLSVRLVQCILHKSYLARLQRVPAAAAASVAAAAGWRGFEDAVRQVRGPAFDEAQTGDEKAAVKTRQMLNGHSHGDGGNVGKVVIVFFLGGVCRAEVAALRFLAKRLKDEGMGRRIVVCTTGVVRGDGVVGAAVEEASFKE